MVNKLKQEAYTKIFVTRPRPQNIKLQKQLIDYFAVNGAGFPVVSLPLIEIVPHGELFEANAIHQALTQTDWVNFVSPNAFMMTYQLLKKYDLVWPCHLKIAVVGGGTESSILQSGLAFQQTVKPLESGSWDSEGLWDALTKAQPQWNDVKVVMIHGDGGRNFLAEKFADCGAKIQEFSVYRRDCLSLDDPAWQEFDANESSIWVFNSSQAAEFLIQGLQKLDINPLFLKKQLAIVSHPRILENVLKLGFTETKLIDPGDENLMKELLHIIKTAL